MNKKHGILSEPGTLQFERLLPGPIERVWAYLTESDKKEKWLAAGKIEPRIGGLVKLTFRHCDLSETDDPVPEKYMHMQEGTCFTGRVTKWEPPRLLSYTWGEPTGEVSEVTFELTPKGEKILLVLTHRRLGDDPMILISVSSGWHTHLEILADRLEGKQPQGFWKVHTQMEMEYERVLNIK